MYRDLVKFALILAVSAFWGAGCEDIVQKPDEPRRVDIPPGMKLDDLKPVHPVELPPEVHFQVFTFEVEPEKIGMLDVVFGLLSEQPIRFTSKESFRANALRIGFAKQGQWDTIAAELDIAGAKALSSTSIISFDDEGLDFMTVDVEVSQKVEYMDYGGEEAELELDAGQLAWTISSRPLERIKGVAAVKVKALYRTQVDSAGIRSLQAGEARKTVLNFASFALKMSKGDLVLLGPGRFVAGDKVTLDRMLFSFKKKQGERMLKLYMIICTKVDN